MNKLLLITLLFLGIANYSQNISANELITISNMDLEKFDSYINSKGFTYYRNISDENSTGIRYRYLLNNSKRYCSLSIYPRNVSIVTYQTFNNKDYVNLKTQIKNIGFKLIKQSEFNGVPYFEYRKGNNSFTIYLFTIDGINSYEISYSKNY